MRVLLTPDNRSSAQVLTCLLGWSRCGLLEPFAWQSVSEASAIQTTMRVSRIEAGETRHLLLGAALQGADGSEDELVAFHPATESEGFSAAFADTANAFLHLLSQILAHDSSRPARCTMVVAPSQIGQDVPSGIFSQAFASNVYVAPEDRAEPRDPNRLLGNEEVFPLHAAHAIATVAGIWAEPAGGDPGVIDVLAKRQPHNQLATQVIRCFTRGIDFGYLPDHVAAGIFQGEGGWPNPDPARFDRVEDATAVVPYLVDDFFRRFESELGLSKFKPQVLGDPEPLGLLEAFRLLIRLVTRRLRRKPFEIVQRRVHAIHDAAADWVERQAGPDSGIRVKRWGAGPASTSEGLALDEVLEKPLVVPDGPVAEAWTALRRLAVGLVDGSDLPDGIDQARLVDGRGQRALITNPALISPDPEGDPPPVEEFADRPICDPRRLDPSLGAAHSADEEATEGLAEWCGRHRVALLWGVGTRIAQALLIAQQEAKAPAEGESESEDEDDAGSAVEERRTLRKRLRRSLIGSTVLAALAALFAGSRLTLVGVGLSLLAIGFLWFLALASAARRLFMADEQISRREDERELAKINAAMKRSLRMGDEIRLARRYREYLAWAEILGWLVHRPWVGDPLDRVTLLPSIDYSSLPAAFTAGVAEVPGVNIERLSAATGSGVFSPGWLADVYERSEQLEMQELSLRRALPPEDAQLQDLDPAADTGQDREGPRTRLLEAVRSGRYRSLVGSDLGASVLRHIGGIRLDDVADRVAVLPAADGAIVGETRDALPPPLAGFQPPTALPRLVEELSPAVVRIDCEEGREEGGSGVLVGDGLVATCSDLAECADSLVVLTAAGMRCEAEVRSLDAESGLALLALGPDFEEGAAPLAGPDSLQPGDPLATIARPHRDSERPAVEWGLVTECGDNAASPDSEEGGTPIGATFDGRQASAGAPLFNLDGKLVGLQLPPTSGERQEIAGQRLARAASVAAIRRLLAGDRDDDGVRPGARPRRPDAIEVKASTFVEGLTHVENPPALLTHHWKDAGDGNKTTETVPAAEDAAAGDEQFANLAASLRFQVPLRVLVHRIDLVAPTNVAKLVSFSVEEAGEEDSEEKVGDLF